MAGVQCANGSGPYQLRFFFTAVTESNSSWSKQDTNLLDDVKMSPGIQGRLQQSGWVWGPQVRSS